ncbi:MAG TPA: hypothetical protein VGD64_01135 [Acidisarcina sp.]
MRRTPTVIACVLALALPCAASEPAIKVEPPQLQGSRPLEKQTESAVIRDYLHSWKTLQAALDQNQEALLDQDFAGTARDKLASTIEDQVKAGIHTRYEDSAHEFRIVFYSPEGLSIQLVDTVDYDQQVLVKDKVLASKHIRQRYVVVLTPSEVRWKVRILQADGPVP